MTTELTAESTTATPAPTTKPLLILLSLAAFVVNLDMFIVNVALPSIRADFGTASTSLSTMSWVLNGYAIVFAALLVPFGRFADLFGRRAGFIGGLLVFAAGSALCALAWNPAALIAARVVQAAGGAMIIPASLSLLLSAVPLAKRSGAIATWVAVGALAAGFGPAAGGLLVTASWRWVFIVNLPICAVAIAGTFFAVRESRDTADRRFPDLLGTALLVCGIATLALGLVKGPDWGWTSYRVLGSFAVTVLALVLFVVRSAAHPVPVVDLGLMRTRGFAVAAGGLFWLTTAFAGLLLGSILFLITVWHYSSLRAGFAISPSPLMVPVVAGLATRLAPRLGRHRIAALGGVLLALGAAYWYVRLGAHPGYAADLLPGTLLSGAGVGMALPCLTAAGVAAVPESRLATGSAVLNMFRQVGAVLGIAILVALIDSATPGGVVDTFRHGWGVVAVTAVLAAAFALFTARPRADR